MSTYLLLLGVLMLMGHSEDGADHAAHERRGAGLRDGEDEGAGLERVFAVSGGGGRSDRVRVREREHWTDTGRTMTKKRRDFRGGIPRKYVTTLVGKKYRIVVLSVVLGYQNQDAHQTRPEQYHIMVDELGM